MSAIRISLVVLFRLQSVHPSMFEEMTTVDFLYDERQHANLTPPLHHRYKRGSFILHRQDARQYNGVATEIHQHLLLNSAKHTRTRALGYILG